MKRWGKGVDVKGWSKVVKGWGSSGGEGVGWGKGLGWR